MSKEKKTTTLYLRRDIVARCNELGINISETVNEILGVLLDRPGIHDEEIALAILRVERQKIERQIEEHRHSIEQLQRTGDALDQKIEKQQQIVDEIARSDAIAQLIRQLNKRIQDEQFDEGKVRESSRDLLEELQKLGVPVDQPTWLTVQIERVKRITL